MLDNGFYMRVSWCPPTGWLCKRCYNLNQLEINVLNLCYETILFYPTNHHQLLFELLNMLKYIKPDMV